MQMLDFGCPPPTSSSPYFLESQPHLNPPFSWLFLACPEVIYIVCCTRTSEELSGQLIH